MSDEHNYHFLCEVLQHQLGNGNAVVTHWSGTEGVSKPYRYEIVLAVKDSRVALEPLLNMPATLTAKTPGGTMKWHGIITQASQEGHDDVYDFYRVVLEPRLARLRAWRWSDIYLNQQLDDIIISLLAHADLNQPYVSDDQAYDYRIAATGMAATKQEFACQFEESCLDFLMRKLEHYGVYFWFEQGESHESVVFANDVSQQPQDAVSAVHYARGTLDTESREIAITRIDRHVGMPVEKVTLHDSPEYGNTRIDLTANPTVSMPPRHLGEYQSYSEHFTSVSGDDVISGNALANWRAQELLCASQQIKGQVRTPGIVVGHLLTVQEHRPASSDDYYVIQLSHEGYQTLETSRKSDEPPYRGSFVALPRWATTRAGPEADMTPLQFRPQRSAPMPRIMYMVNGFIDTGTANSPKRYAQLDEKGRYHVRFCFARQLNGGDKNSAWLRMATPYAAGEAMDTSLSTAGMHFPLREGTEVLISFLNGDPDRPVIVSALPNVEAPSVVTSTNPSEHRITTPAGNTLALRDAAVGTDETASSSDPSINLYSPTDKSSLNLGKTDDPAVGDGFHLTTDTNGTIHAGTSMLIEVPGHLRMAAGGGGALNNFLGTSAQGMPPGVNVSTSGGVVISNYVGANIQSTAGASVQHFLGVKAQFTEALFAETNLAAGLKLDVSATKDLNPSSKTEIYGDHTFTFVNATWTGGNWAAAIGNKRETVATSNTQAAGPYLVTAPDLTLNSGLAELSLAGPAVALSSTGAATISSGAITEISGETCVGITSGGTTFMATPSSIMATATSITLMGAGDIGLDAGVGSAVIRGTVIALG